MMVDADPDAVGAAVASSEQLAPYRADNPDGRLWVAFSGGMDSTVLLHALCAWPGVAAVHVNHGVAEESQGWVRHCREVAGDLGVAFRAVEAVTEATRNLEARLRKARYAALASVLGPGDAMAVAHHADDQAETRLWQFLTGRHPGGMPGSRTLAAGRLVRPLLQVRRASIAAYANRHGLRWVDDPSNADLGLDRNFIRHRLMPLVEERFPAAFEELAAPRRAAAPADTLSATAQEQEVRAWLERAGMPLAARTIAEIRRQGLAAPDRNPIVRVAPGVHARRHQGVWWLVRDEVGLPPAKMQAIPPTVLRLPSGKLSWHRTSQGIPAGRTLEVRARSGGEKLRTQAGTRTVKALFQQNRVPPWQRPTWPLLYDGDTLVAVPNLGLAVSESTPNGWTPAWTPHEQEVGT
ncbi:MAG: tRNA lysidine(34) synthetase TilS [Gammaproteobacteria bacterium]|nr:tRNA lysidine(34) synthetase TilS [Gammaproteobacteria bacterium]MYB36999.1 tRNA lysidine(34) synthetase TilS [Gammaproteobacteria bacterium]